MAKFRVMTERAVYTPFFKVFDGETMAHAEQAAEAEVEAMTMRQELSDLGWDEGDASTEYEVRGDATEALKQDGALRKEDAQ